jgi:hypothetical protein
MEQYSTSVICCIAVYEIISKQQTRRSARKSVYSNLFYGLNLRDVSKFKESVLERVQSDFALSQRIKNEFDSTVANLENEYFLMGDRMLKNKQILHDAAYEYFEGHRLTGPNLEQAVEQGIGLFLDSFSFYDTFNTKTFSETREAEDRKNTLYTNILGCFEHWNISKGVIDKYGKAVLNSDVKYTENGEFILNIVETVENVPVNTPEFTNTKLYKDLMNAVVDGSDVLFKASRSDAFNGRCRNIMTYYCNLEAEQLDAFIDDDLDYKFSAIYKNMKHKNPNVQSTTEADIILDGYSIISNLDSCIDSNVNVVDTSNNFMVFQNKVRNEFIKNCQSSFMLSNRAVKNSTFSYVYNNSEVFNKVLSGVLAAKQIINILKQNGYSVLVFPNYVITDASQSVRWTKKSKLQELIVYRNIDENILGSRYSGGFAAIYNPLTVDNIYTTDNSSMQDIKKKTLELYKNLKKFSTSSSVSLSRIYQNEQDVEQDLKPLGTESGRNYLYLKFKSALNNLIDGGNSTQYDDMVAEFGEDIFSTYKEYKDLSLDVGISMTQKQIIVFATMLLSWFLDSFIERGDVIRYTIDVDTLLELYDVKSYEILRKTFSELKMGIYGDDGSEYSIQAKRIYSELRHTGPDTFESLEMLLHEFEKALHLDTNNVTVKMVGDFKELYKQVCDKLAYIILSWNTCSSFRETGGEDDLEDSSFLRRISHNSRSEVFNLFNIVVNIRFLSTVILLDNGVQDWLNHLQHDLASDKYQSATEILTTNNNSLYEYPFIDTKVLCFFEKDLRDLLLQQRMETLFKESLFGPLIANSDCTIWNFTQLLYNHIKGQLKDLELTTRNYCFESLAQTIHDSKELTFSIKEDEINRSFNQFILYNSSYQLEMNAEDNIKYILLDVRAAKDGDNLVRYKNGKAVVISVSPYVASSNLIAGDYYISTFKGLLYHVGTKRVSWYTNEMTPLLKETLIANGEEDRASLIITGTDINE